MPYHFNFYNDTNDPQPRFTCAIESERCHGETKNGTRCSRKCVIGTPYCWSHLLSNYNLRILPSTIPNAGKGLFIMNKQEPEGKVIIKKGTIVCPYGGELIDKQTLDERYGKKTSPYGIYVSTNNYRDAGCARGVGSVINHDSRKQNVIFTANHKSKSINIKVSRDLVNGEELFVSYGRSYRLNDGSKYSTTTR